MKYLICLLLSYIIIPYSQAFYDLNKLELSSINYLQSNGKSHSLRVGWTPRIITFNEFYNPFSINLNFNISHINLKHESKNSTSIIGLDLLLNYEINNDYSVDFFFGSDRWSGYKSFLEVGSNFVISTPQDFVIFEESDFITNHFLGLSYIFNTHYKTYNVVLGLKASF